MAETTPDPLEVQEKALRKAVQRFGRGAGRSVIPPFLEVCNIRHQMIVELRERLEEVTSARDALAEQVASLQVTTTATAAVSRDAGRHDDGVASDEDVDSVWNRVPSPEDPWMYFLTYGEMDALHAELGDGWEQHPRVTEVSTRREFWWDPGNDYVYQDRKPGESWGDLLTQYDERPEAMNVPPWVWDLCRGHLDAPTNPRGHFDARQQASDAEAQ